MRPPFLLSAGPTRDQWGPYEQRGVVLPLDIQRELERFGTRRQKP